MDRDGNSDRETLFLTLTNPRHHSRIHLQPDAVNRYRGFMRREGESERFLETIPLK